MAYPSFVGCPGLLVVFILCQLAGTTLFDALTQPYMCVIKHISNKVNTSSMFFSYRKYLVIVFYAQVQFYGQVFAYVGQQLVQIVFIAA